MTIIKDTTLPWGDRNRVIDSNAFTSQQFTRFGENSPLLPNGEIHIQQKPSPVSRSLFRKLERRWVPGETEAPQKPTDHDRSRPWRRRLFLILTEPDTSFVSVVFFGVLILAIALSNIIMMMQTMDYYQFVPTDCVSCGGSVSYIYEDDAIVAEPEDYGIPCVCPPSPLPFTNHVLDGLMYFLTVEWFLRVLLYVPAEPAATFLGRCSQWVGFLTNASTLLDGLAIFPYYLEQLPNGLVSLRVFRLFRIFQLVRLGQYNDMFTILTNVLKKSIVYLKLLGLVMLFGAAFFGSIMYWLEKGKWKYHEASGEYKFLRVGIDGVTEEPTPFTSIPAAFWWFFVTATTVGYGDYYPTSTAGKYVATFAMLTGVLVIAFPVSVFSELWQKELRQYSGFEELDGDDGQVNAALNGKDAEQSAEERANWRAEAESLPGRVVIEKKDLKEIMECMQTMRESEQRMRAILRNYQV